MGWTTLHKSKGHTMQAFFQGELGDTTVIVKSAYKGFVFYAACYNTARPADVWALVVLTKNCGSFYDNFAFKMMDETCGPNEVGCPASILDLLSPTDSAVASDWRKSCREQLAVQGKTKAVVPGTVITYPMPLDFGYDYGTHSRFEYIGTLGNKRNVWRIADDTPQSGRFVTIRNWRSSTVWAIDAS